MKRMVIGVMMAVLLATGGVYLAGCSATKSAPTPTITGIVVSGNQAFTTKNQTNQLTATANFSNSNTQTVTNQAQWSSGNSSVASVSSTGVVTSVAAGTSTITAIYQGQSGSLPITVTLSAVPNVTASFFRLCSPFRARIEIGLAETRGDIGYNVTALTYTMSLFGVVKKTRTYSTAELNSILVGGNHINPGQTKFLNDEGPYPGGVDTMDSTASVTVTIVDDAGNSQTIPLNNIRQSDRC
jgi:hypothetical protein